MRPPGRHLLDSGYDNSSQLFLLNFGHKPTESFIECTGYAANFFVLPGKVYFSIRRTNHKIIIPAGKIPLMQTAITLMLSFIGCIGLTPKRGT